LIEEVGGYSVGDSPIDGAAGAGWAYIKPQQNRAVEAEVQAEGNLSSTSTIASEQ
jgi:hypothetical protein